MVGCDEVACDEVACDEVACDANGCGKRKVDAHEGQQAARISWG